jgi:amino acid transporter
MTTTAEDYAGTIGEGSEGKGLKEGALGLLSSIVVAIASVAPAYSLAAALGFVVLAVGLQSPIVMLLAFVPMMFVAVGYQQLNKDMPDCGTTFTWGAKAFGPVTGWLGGWPIWLPSPAAMGSSCSAQTGLPATSGGFSWPG